MKILLLGANGQLGHELKRKLPASGELKACTRADVDFTDKDSIRTAIATFRPDVIVNAAAYTAVDQAESEPEPAFQINAGAVAVLAHEAAERGIWLIHYSTDYVFDGAKKQPYTETDTPNPVNLYGESKLAGEKAIADSGCKHLVFRTSWVIGAHGKNFAKTIFRLAKQRDSLKVVDDQSGVPTTPALIAKVTCAAIQTLFTMNPWPTGIYHLAPHGRTTWYGIAQALLQLAKEQQITLTVDPHALHPIQTADYPTAAKRPANSMLDTSKLEQMLDFDLPHWQHDFAAVAHTIIQESDGQAGR